MAKFEVTMGVEGKNENEVLSNVYKALYTGDLDADYVKVRPEKRRGQLVPEVNPRVVQRLTGQADAEIARITGASNQCGDSWCDRPAGHDMISGHKFKGNPV